MSLSFRIEIIDIDGELGIVFPPELVEEYGLTPDSNVTVETKNGALFLRFLDADKP